MKFAITLLMVAALGSESAALPPELCGDECRVTVTKEQLERQFELMQGKNPSFVVRALGQPERVRSGADGGIRFEFGSHCGPISVEFRNAKVTSAEWRDGYDFDPNVRMAQLLNEGTRRHQQGKTQILDE
jgi:hypothetical protein